MFKKVIVLILAICLFIIGQIGHIFAAGTGKLNVPNDVHTYDLTLNPQGGPPSPVEGRVYYDNGTKKFYINIDGTVSGWKPLGVSGDGHAVTKIVAAYNSVGSTRDGTNPCLGDGSVCNNPKADYTCRGAGFTGDINNDGTNENPSSDVWIIKYALDQLGSTGGVVYLLEGTYNAVNDGLIQLGSPTSVSDKALIGAGNGTIIKFNESATQQGFWIWNAQRFTLSQMTLDGSSNSSGVGIRLNNVQYSVISKIAFINSLPVGSMYFSGVSLNNSSYNTISDVKPNTADGSKICMALLNSHYNSLADNFISGRDYQYQDSDDGDFLWAGLLLYKSNNNIITRNYIEKSGNYSPSAGILLKTCEHNSIFQNRLFGNGNQGVSMVHNILLRNSSYCRIANNTIARAGGDWGGNGITIELGAANSITDNVITGHPRYGINLNGTSSGLVTGNILFNNSTAGNCGEISVSGSTTNLIWGNFIYHSPAATGIDNEWGTNNYLAGNYLYDTTFPYNYVFDMVDTANGTQYTGPTKITLEPCANFTFTDPDPVWGTKVLTPSGPTSYIRLNMDTICGSCTQLSIRDIAPGKSSGDILILENSSNSSDKYVQLYVGTYMQRSAALGKNDTLVLIWDSYNSKWVRVAKSDNVY